MRIYRRGERRHEPREPLRQEQVLRLLVRHSDRPAPKRVELRWEGESRSLTAQRHRNSQSHFPRQATAIRVATLDRDDGKQGRRLLFLQGLGQMPQVRWHRAACDRTKRVPFEALRPLHDLRGFREVRALSRHRTETTPGVSSLQHRKPRMLCQSSWSDGWV